MNHHVHANSTHLPPKNITPPHPRGQTVCGPSYGPSSGPNGHLQVSHENGAPGCLRFRRDYTTQLCGDYHKPYLKI